MKKHQIIIILTLIVSIADFSGCLEEQSFPQYKSWNEGDKIFIKLENEVEMDFKNLSIKTILDDNLSYIEDYDIIKINNDNIWNEGEILVFKIEDFSKKNGRISLINASSQSLLIEMYVQNGKIDMPS